MTEMLTSINNCSVMLMVSIIMILGVVRSVASWREGDTVSVSGPKQLQSQGEQGAMALNHQNLTVASD